MIYWTLFVLKYFALYVALVNFSNSAFMAISFWTRIEMGKQKFGMWTESLSFTVYLALSNFV